MSLSRKRQESHRTVKLQQDGGDQQQVVGGNQSILSICSAKQSSHMPPQYSMNNTPSSQSTSLRLQTTQTQQQQSYEHHNISNSQSKQQQHAVTKNQPTSNLTVMGKKSSLKTSQRKANNQKQNQALISTSNSASLAQTGNAVGNNQHNRGGVTTPMGSSQDTSKNGSNPTNFSCLIQKQLTSSNYGGGSSVDVVKGGGPQYTSKSGTTVNQGVTRSLEKLSYKAMHSSSTTANQQDGNRTGGSQSQHNSVSLSRVHAIISGSHQQQQQLMTETTNSQQSGSQYNRGSQQPQQKQKIKAFKTRGGGGEHVQNNNLLQQSADGKLLSYYGAKDGGQNQQQVIMSRNGGIQRVATTTTSEVSSVRTTGGAIVGAGQSGSNAGGSSKRSNGGGNFVSLGGVSKTVAGGATTDQASLKQSSLPVNSSSSLKSHQKDGSLLAPVVTANATAGQQQQNPANAAQSSSTKSGGAMGSSVLSSSTGYPGQGPITQTTKIGVFRADRLNSQRGGAGHQVKIPASSAKLMRPHSSKKSGREGRVTGQSEAAQQQQLSSSSINSQTPNMPKSKRVGGSQASHQKTTSSNAGDTDTSYYPKLQNLNSSQEIVLKQPGSINSGLGVNSSKQTQYAIGQMITSPNQACILPGHMIKANGPNSMQASSKPTSTQQSFLPPQTSQNTNVLLSASFEKLNLWNPQGSSSAAGGTKSNLSTAKQSQNSQAQQQPQSSSLRSHQQILRQHQTNMQAYLHGVNSGGINPVSTSQQQSANTTSNTGGSKTTSLKVKKAAISGGTKASSKSFMTPQRLSKNKAPAAIQQPQVVSSSLKEQISLGGSKHQAANKAQQYLRNSFMAKQHQVQQQQSQQASSISPRGSNLTGIPNNSRNSVIKQASTSQSVPQPQSQSLNTTSTAVVGTGKDQQQYRHSPLGSLPQPSASSFHQMATKQKQKNQQQALGNNGAPKNLNILSKGGINSKAAMKPNAADKQVQQQLNAQQKLMIDKKTYEDLMSYLVKAECKRLKHQDDGMASQNTTTVKTPQNSNQQLLQMKPSNSNSNLNSINSQSKPKMASPGGRPALGISNSTAASGKKPKDNQLIPNSQQPPNQVAFQSQQPVARQGAWQNQTSHSNHLLRAENHSQENPKQHSSKQQQQNNLQQRILPSQKHVNLPMNAASKNKVAVTSFMVAPGNNIHPAIQQNNQKTQMLKTTISQTSQSRDASLTSHKTANGQGAAAANTSQGKGTKISMKQVNMSLFPAGHGKQQNLVTKQGGAAPTRNGKPQQLFVKGAKQVGVQSRNGNNLLQGISNSRNSQNQNNTVYTVSLKSTNNLPFPDMLHQPSPNQTVISSGQVRAAPPKKGVANMVAATIPTKIIKARSLIRGTAGQAPVNAKVMVNVLKKHANNAAPVPQETLKNNFMGPLKGNHSQKQSQENVQQTTGQPPKRPIGGGMTNPPTVGNRSSRTGISDLQLKSVNFSHKDRVQSAKSSGTTRGVAQQQHAASNHTHSKNSSNLQRASLARSNAAVSNGGAQSHRESQRYFSRPSGGENQQQIPRSTNQSLSSKERQRKRPSADSQSNRGSSKSIGRMSRHSNTSQTQQQDSANKQGTSGSKRRAKKRSSKRMLNVAVEGAGGNTTDLEQTILSGVQLIGDSSMLTADKHQLPRQQHVVMKDSCDIGADDAMEGMVGGNFNTFGEQAPKDFFQKQQKQSSLEEMITDHPEAAGASETLIERIEKQIEAELRDSKDAASSAALHPMFEVNELSNNSIGTHDSNTIDMVAKPPQNSLAPQIEDDCLLQTIQSRERDPTQTIDTHEAEHQSHKAVRSNKVEGLQNFHYSGSFGIPESSLTSSPYKDGPILVERETIAIEPAQLYAAMQPPQPSPQCNTIDGTDPQSKINTNKLLHGKPQPGGGGALLLAAKSEEYQDIIQEQRQHQTLQEESTNAIHHHQQHKGHFQLINMSFSQENASNNDQADQHRHQRQTPDTTGSKGKKNPHNTLVDDSQMMLQQSSADYGLNENGDIVNGIETDAENNTASNIILVTKDLQSNEDEEESVLASAEAEQSKMMVVKEKIYSDSEYRKQLLLRVLPKFEKFDQFDELHTDFVTSTEQQADDEELKKNQEDVPQPTAMAVSTGAAQLLRQINLSLGREASSIIAPIAAAKPPADGQTVDESLDERLEINTVVENECDNEFDYNYSGGPSLIKGECQSPSMTSDERQIKSFETPSMQSPQNSTRIELQTPSNVTSALQSHYASQNTTNPDDDQAETRLILLQSSEPESHRKQGGAFAVCSPRTAALASAIYEDGANGGRQAVIAMSSVRNSKQINDQDMLPQFGCLVAGQGSNQDYEGEEDEEECEDEEINQSFQTVLAGDDTDSKFLHVDVATGNNSCQYYEESSVNQGAVTSFYGPEKPQYDEMVSIIQHNGLTMDDDELMDEQTVSQIDAYPSPYQDGFGKQTVVMKGGGGQLAKKRQLGDTSSSGTAQVLHVGSTADGDDTGGGSQAQSQSPHSIEQFRKVKKPIGAAKTKQSNNKNAKRLKQQQHQSEEDEEDEEDEEEDEDDDQFQFVQNLNKQYADAMQQRKFMKMMNKPRQNSC